VLKSKKQLPLTYQNENKCKYSSVHAISSTGQIGGLITTHQKIYIMKEKQGGNENKEK
jgi:hypothetical protein